MATVFPTSSTPRRSKRATRTATSDIKASGLLYGASENGPDTFMFMATVEEALALGLRCHQSGNLAEAAQIYREILQTAPDNVRVLALLGIVALAQNRLDEAIDSLRHALQIDPDRSDLWNNLGVACARHGKPAE